MEKWSKTADYLTENIPGGAFQIIPLDFNEIHHAVESKVVDFVIVNPSIYVELSKWHHVGRLATLMNHHSGQDSTKFGGVVFYRADNKDIKTVQDLKNKRFAAVDEKSFGGWRVAWRELKDIGLDPFKDFTDFFFAGTHDAVVYAVVNQQADAGTVRTDTLERMAKEGKVSLKSFKVLKFPSAKSIPRQDQIPYKFSTRLYPEWAFAKVDHMPEQIAGQVATTLIDMPFDSPAAESGNYAGWTVPLNYQPVRECLQELKVGPYRDIWKKDIGKEIERYRYWLIGTVVFILILAFMVAVMIINSVRLRDVQHKLRTELEERKIMEEKLREREQRNRLLTENVIDFIWSTDRDFKFTYVSPSVIKFLGYTMEEIYQLSALEVLTTDSFQRAKRIFDEEIEKENVPGTDPFRSRTLELEHVCKDGRTIWGEVKVTFLRDEIGQRIGFQGVSRNITERRQAEQALKKSEQKYRELVQNANNIILRMDMGGRISFINEFAEKFFGYSQEEIIGRSVLDTIVPEKDRYGADLKTMIASIIKNIKDHKINENENIKKNGDRVWITWTNRVVIREETGEQEILCVGTDMTQRKAMEAEMNRMFYAVEQSPSSIVITDTKGDIEYVNPKFCDLTGYTFEEAKGKNPRILKSGEMDDQGYKRLWETIVGGDSWRGEFHNKKKSGEFYWESAVISPVRNIDGEITSFLAVKEDITEQKKTQQELHEAFGRLKEMERIINKSKAVAFLWRTSDEWPVEFVSDNVRIFGFEPDDFMSGKLNYESIVHPADLKRLQTATKTFMKEKSPEFKQEYRIITKFCETRWVEEYTWLLLNDEGIATHFQGVVFDITARKLAEEKILEVVNMKSEFLSVVSHELRTPLTAIRESINIVAQKEAGEVNDKQVEFLGIAKRNVDRLSILINDVLDFQKLETGRMEFNFQKANLNEVVKESHQTMSPVAKNKGLELCLEIAEGLPAVNYDYNRLIQVLTNLINNAIKFTEKGYVRLRTFFNEQSVYVAVEDSGIGIKKEDMHKLFQSFSQVASANDRITGGTGLGLVICKEIVNAHGGYIWVDSIYGQGSSFIFSIPVIHE